MPDPQMCTVDDLTGEEPCLRAAQWEWHPDGPHGHPVHLCNFHAEPFAEAQPVAGDRDE